MQNQQMLCTKLLITIRRPPSPPPPQPFYGLFSGTTQVSWCLKRTSGLHGARED